MIFQGEKEVVDLRLDSNIGQVLYIGAKRVWDAIRSCFGKGYWVDEKPWSDTDGWKDN